jgi:hypothetical protein
MNRQLLSKQSRNKQRTRKDSSKVEQYLTRVEKVEGCARAWHLRQQLEAGQVSLDDLKHGR